MPTTVDEIKSAEWSLSTAGFGEVAEGIDDINQCITLILSTQKGSDPLRPEFGSDIWRYMDYGIDTAVPFMVREILSALSTWEGRINVTDVTYTIGEKNVGFDILWNLKGNRQKGNSQILLSLVPTRDIVLPEEESQVPDFAYEVEAGGKYYVTETEKFYVKE